MNKLSLVEQIEFNSQPQGESYLVDRFSYTAIERKCMYNALYNNVYFFDHLNLKFKCGYLRISQLEMGHKTLKQSSWCDVKNSVKMGDLHCWLEDVEGNVYDHVQDIWVARLKNFINLKQFRFEKASKHQLLKEFDFEYVPYSDMVCKIAEKYFKNVCF
jgi:hypothetical protein